MEELRASAWRSRVERVCVVVGGCGGGVDLLGSTLSVMVQICNSSWLVGGVGRSGVRGHPWLHREFQAIMS